MDKIVIYDTETTNSTIWGSIIEVGAVVVDKKSDLFLDGTTLDFHEGIDKRGFTFNNPNASKSCGCGSSFQA